MDRHQGIQAAAHTAGSVVDGRYEIIEFLGAGGMSSVYKARDLTIDRLVVLKFIRRELLGNQRSIDRFLREANLCSRLQHSGIVHVFSCGIANEGPYMAMEYIDGASLDKVLAARTDGRFPVEEALPIFEQLCDALAYAHRLGVLHRDLKPHNVMVSESGAVRLVDFGIGSFLGGSSGEIQKLTQTGELIGSVAYMSPEQCRGERLDERSDIYSLGCLMYELLVGTPPFVGTTPYAVLMKHLQEQPKSLPQLNVPLGEAVLTMLEKDPKNRPQSAAAAKELINNPSTRSFKKRVRLPVSIVTIALSSVLLVVCVWTAILQATPDGSERQPLLRPFSDWIKDGKDSKLSFLMHDARDEKLGKHALYCLAEAGGVALDRAEFREACALRSELLTHFNRDDEAFAAARVVADQPPASGKPDDEYRLAMQTLEIVADRRKDWPAAAAAASKTIEYEKTIDPTAPGVGLLYHQLGGYLACDNKPSEAIKAYKSALQCQMDDLAKFLTLRDMGSVRLSSIPALNSASARLREYEAAKKELELAVALHIPSQYNQGQAAVRNQLDACNERMKLERARI